MEGGVLGVQGPSGGPRAGRSSSSRPTGGVRVVTGWEQPHFSGVVGGAPKQGRARPVQVRKQPPLLPPLPPHRCRWASQMPLHPGHPPSPPPSAASTCRAAFSPSLPAGGQRRGGRLRDPSRAPAGTPASPAARTGSLTSTGSRMVQDARRSGPPPSSTPPDPRRPRAGCRASAEGRRQPGTVVRPAPPAVVAAGPKSLPLGCRHPEPRHKPPG